MITLAVDATMAQIPLEIKDLGRLVGKKKRNLQSINPKSEIAPLPYKSANGHRNGAMNIISRVFHASKQLRIMLDLFLELHERGHDVDTFLFYLIHLVGSL